MPRKITPAEYEAWLAQDGRGIVALEPYAGSGTPILHQCPEGHQRKIRPDSIKQGDGCRDCYENKLKKLAEEYPKWLEQNGKGIVAREPYAGAHTPIKHQCAEGHQWDARPNSIKQGQGCGVCHENKFKKIAEEYSQWLEQDGRGIVAREPYVGGHTPILHQCSEGHPPWPARPSHIKGGRGCGVCYENKLKKLAEEYPKWLEQDGRGIVALEPYAGAHTPIKHQCPEGHQWDVTPANIKSGRGCGDCSDIGTDASVFYVYENALDAGVYKVGITSERCADERIAICTRKNKMTANIILMIAVRDARDIERRALEIGESVDYPSSVDGYTEFRRYTDDELGAVWQLAVRSAA